ncbi:ribosome recycling factor [Acidobacteriota bacterium]
MTNQIMNNTKKRMDSTVISIQKELATIRTGRASLSILDGVSVDYFGTETPLNQVASLSVPEGNLIVIQPWDTQLINEIERAILKANLDLTPQNDGKVIRIPIPPLTEERRQKLARTAKDIGEEGKTAVRHIRRDANEEIKVLEKEKKISQDDQHRTLQKIQEVTDEHTKEIDELVKKKETEILEF